MRTRADLIRDIEEAETQLKSLREKMSETEKEYRSIREFFDKLYDPKRSFRLRDKIIMVGSVGEQSNSSGLYGNVVCAEGPKKVQPLSKQPEDGCGL